MRIFHDLLYIPCLVTEAPLNAREDILIFCNVLSVQNHSSKLLIS